MSGSNIVVEQRASHALARDRLGVMDVVGYTITAATPLTVVAGIITTGFAVTGLTGMPSAFVVVAVALALFSVGFVAMARHVANAGAFYSYVAQGIGRATGVGASWVALLAYNSLQVGLYGAIGTAAAPVLADWFGLEVPWWIIALVACAIIAVLGTRQVELNGRVLAVLLAAELAIIIAYSLASLAQPAEGALNVATFDPRLLLEPGTGALLSLAVLGFVGFESSVVFAEETRNPQRTVRIATYLSIALVAVLYAMSSWAMSVATGPANIVSAAREQGADLIFNLAGAHLGPTFVHIGRILFVTSVFAAMMSFHNTAARYAFALGREHVLPAFLGRVSPRTGAPIYGSIAQSVIALIAIAFVAFSGLDPLVHLFYGAGTFGGIGVLLLIAITSVSVVVFFAKQPMGENIWRRRIAPGLAVIAIGVVLWLVLANIAILLGVAEGSTATWLIPLLYLVVGLSGCIWGLILRRSRPETYVAIGRGAKTATVPTVSLEQTVYQ